MIYCTVLEEDHVHELEGTCGWDPLWRGEITIYEEEGSHCGGYAFDYH